MLLPTSCQHGYVDSVIVATWNELNKLTIRIYRDFFVRSCVHFARHMSDFSLNFGQI